MQVRIRETGAVMYEAEFRAYQQANGGPAWGQTTEEVLEALGADVVFEGPQAQPTRYQIAFADGVEQIDGKWYTNYVLGPIFTDTTAEDGTVTTAAQHEAAYKAQKDAEQAKGVREERNRKLTETDWTQLADAPVNSVAWSNYRQALRTLPEQAGFPFNVQWPEQP